MRVVCRSPHKLSTEIQNKIVTGLDRSRILRPRPPVPFDNSAGLRGFRPISTGLPRGAGVSAAAAQRPRRPLRPAHASRHLAAHISPSPAPRLSLSTGLLADLTCRRFRSFFKNLSGNYHFPLDVVYLRVLYVVYAYSPDALTADAPTSRPRNRLRCGRLCAVRRALPRPIDGSRDDRRAERGVFGRGQLARFLVYFGVPTVFGWSDRPFRTLGVWTLTATLLATLALEVWRASGPRTEQRRDALLISYAESYFGPVTGWQEPIKDLVADARLMLRQRTRIDELHYT